MKMTSGHLRSERILDFHVFQGIILRVFFMADIDSFAARLKPSDRSRCDTRCVRQSLYCVRTHASKISYLTSATLAFHAGRIT